MPAKKLPIGLTGSGYHVGKRLLDAWRHERAAKNDLIRGKFGDRITPAFDSECKARDVEIAAIDGLLELLGPEA